MKNEFRPETTYSDVDEGYFIFERYGRAVFRAKPWIPGHRSDVIMFDAKIHEKDFQALKISKSIPKDIEDTLLLICKTYWDCFASEGVMRTILGFEFSIDTGDHTPVCCKKPVYGPHESIVIMQHIRTLLHNRWAKEVQGSAWGFPIVLAPKPHQEEVINIDDYIWRMCVSYRGLNRVTKIFAYPISRCDSSIEDMGDYVGILFFISLDAKQGYHQVKVREQDQEKLAFYGPNNKMYTYNVLPFGCVNGPTFYTCMKRTLQDQWTKLFRQRINRQDIDLNREKSGQPDWVVSVKNISDDYEATKENLVFPDIELDEEYILAKESNVLFEKGEEEIELDGGMPVIKSKMNKSDRVHVTGSRTIIDDIILWSTARILVLILFECVCRVFLKHRVSFNSKKCEFFSERFEYVGHDILPQGNTTAKSKYKLIDKWKLPTTGDNLHSFVSFCNFYAKFSPLFQLKMIPLRQLYLKYVSREIPQMEWTPVLIHLFQRMKEELTKSPVLARYDSGRPTFLKTDYSALGMAYIIMQPEDSDKARMATQKLEETGECTFDLSIGGPRLKPVAFGSRKCSVTESNYHSYVGEIATGRWAMSENKTYLWGAKFTWLCDMKSISKILEYDGHIHMLCRYSQEMMAYNFDCVHRSNTMMRDVDALSRMYDPLIAEHIELSYCLRERDKRNRPEAYSSDHFDELISKGVYSLRKNKETCSISENTRDLGQALLRSSETFAASRKHSKKTKKVKGAEPSFSRADVNSISCSTKQENRKREYIDINHANDRKKRPRVAKQSNSNVKFVRDIVHLVSTNSIIASIDEDRGGTSQPNKLDVLTLHSLDESENMTVRSKESISGDGVQSFLAKYQKHWVSITPGIPSIIYHMERLVGARIDLTVVHQNSEYAKLVKQLIPSATVICCELQKLYNMLKLPELPNDTIIREAHGKIYYSMQDTCIAQAEADIYGVDVIAKSRIRFPIRSTRPKEMGFLLELIDRFAKYRNLKCFVFICSPMSSTGPNADDLGRMFPNLQQWRITSELTDCAQIGDPISAHRAVIIGVHNSIAGPVPDEGIKLRRSEEPSVILDHLNMNLNTKLGALQEIQSQEMNKANIECPPRSPRPIALARGENSQKLDNCDLILHTAYPGVECDVNSNEVERQSFLIPFICSLSGRHYVRALHSSEVLALYTSGLTNYMREKLHSITSATNICPTIRGCCPWRTGAAIAEYVVDAVLNQDIVHREDVQEDIVRCHLTKPVPSKDQWDEAYRNDKETNYMLTRLKDDDEWQERELLSVHRAYRPAIREKRLKMKLGRLIVMSPIAESNKFLTLIVVPESLRVTVFQAYHCTGVGGHMGTYKTLLVLRLRFFWPNMRSNVIAWVQQCSGCIHTTVRRRENTGLVMSWPLSTPFSVISVDLWSPGKTETKLGFKHLLNSMCDMSQFVVSVPVKQTSASYLARVFMENVLLKFGICAVIVVDDGSTFRGLFEEMCSLLKIRFHAAAKRNHRSIGVERFHAFLNRGTTIFSEERGSNECFVEAAMVLAYAWNASPIDGTGIIRSVPALGRELKFPLDIELQDAPPIEDDDGERLLDYVRHLGRSVPLVQKILAFMLEERRIERSERINERRNRVKYKVGDVVMARVAVQSDKSKNKVAKLVYKSRGPFIIMEDTGLGSYKCRRYGRPNGALYKFLTEDIYLLPPQILPCDEVDTPDLRYLNSDFAPNLKHPFHKDFDIQAYNTRWFDDDEDENGTEKAAIGRKVNMEDFLPDLPTENRNMTSEAQTAALMDDESTGSEDNDCLNKVTEDIEDITTTVVDGEVALLEAKNKPSTVDGLNLMLAQSVDKLFFIQYVPSGTLRPRWYVVQVNEEESKDTSEKGVFLCEFLQKHTSDKYKSDSRSRWWPEWRELNWSNDGTVYDYGRRVLLSPRSKPDLQKYGKFSDNIRLLDENVYLIGPFDFAKKDRSTPGQSIIPEERWLELSEICEFRNIIPPSIEGRRSRRGQAAVNVLREKLQAVDLPTAMDSSLGMLERLFAKKGGRGRVRDCGKFEW